MYDAMSDDNMIEQPTDVPEVREADPNEWASPVRIRKGTRKRLDEVIGMMAVPAGPVASLPEEVLQSFREAFALARFSYTPDVVIDTAVAALKNMLTVPAPDLHEPVVRKPAKGRGR